MTLANGGDRNTVLSITQDRYTELNPGGYTHNLPKNAQRIAGVELRYR